MENTLANRSIRQGVVVFVQTRGWSATQCE